MLFISNNTSIYKFYCVMKFTINLMDVIYLKEGIEPNNDMPNFARKPWEGTLFHRNDQLNLVVFCLVSLWKSMYCLSSPELMTSGLQA